MKRIFTMIASVGFLSIISAQTPTEPAKAPSVTWNETTHNFGNIKMGGPAEAVFTFTNKSNGPIQVISAQASCGCTTPSWTTTEVAKGQTGTIKASYGTDGRPGSFTKNVTVKFSDGTETTLIITGNVITETTPEPANGGGSQ